ncbi:putative peptidase m24 protein [Mycena sanguinolenta]|uniref:Putative peptidase m24 protein n=1 Tax=Mycena sanguinolenta TaxID=230812 RepID=A0A8H7DMS6_9AGAR|nr:putative peptidase m24 protein [Mycena sanguinolenta]
MATAEAEQQRAASLLDAQNKAAQMFTEIEQTLIKPGVSDKALSDQIHQLGTDMYGVRTHWHKRIVRSGPNTLRPFEDNPPDRVIQPDDILVVDLGPVFEEWEADFGRTYVLGEDAAKLRLRDALEPIWRTVHAHFHATPDITGAQLFARAQEEVKKAGFEWGNSDIAGHLVGHFPHERIPRDKIALYITEQNDAPMRSAGKDGFQRQWILEVYLQDEKHEYQAFFEQLLTTQ